MVSLLALKPVTAQMLSAVLELDRLCFGGLWTQEGYLRELESSHSVLLGLFAPPTPSSPTAPLLGMGCFWAILEEAHITILAVHPHYRHQGLGQALLAALLAVASSRGLERATLEVRASNQAATSLYQKFGFKPVGRRRRYYPDLEDALILWRNDLHSPEFNADLNTWQQAASERLATYGWELQASWGSLLSERSS